MNSKEILDRAASLIEKKGLARGCAQNVAGGYCLAASLVEAAGMEGWNITPQQLKKREEAYVTARNFLCGHLGISSSYEALANYNDDSFVTKKGEVRFRHTQDEILRSIYDTIKKLNSTPS